MKLHTSALTVILGFGLLTNAWATTQAGSNSGADRVAEIMANNGSGNGVAAGTVGSASSSALFGFNEGGAFHTKVIKTLEETHEAEQSQTNPNITSNVDPQTAVDSANAVPLIGERLTEIHRNMLGIYSERPENIPSCGVLNINLLPDNFKQLVQRQCPMGTADFCACYMTLIRSNDTLAAKIREESQGPRGVQQEMKQVVYEFLLERWAERLVDNTRGHYEMQARMTGDAKNGMTLGQGNACDTQVMLNSLVVKMRDSSCKGNKEAFGHAVFKLLNLPRSNNPMAEIASDQSGGFSRLTQALENVRSSNVIMQSRSGKPIVDCLPATKKRALALFPRKIPNITGPAAHAFSSEFAEIKQLNAKSLGNLAHVQESLRRWRAAVDSPAFLTNPRSGSPYVRANGDQESQANVREILGLFPQLENFLKLDISAAPGSDTQMLARRARLKAAIERYESFITEMTKPNVVGLKMSDWMAKLDENSGIINSYAQEQTQQRAEEFKAQTLGICAGLQKDLESIACTDDPMLDNTSMVYAAYQARRRNRNDVSPQACASGSFKEEQSSRIARCLALDGAACEVTSRLAGTEVGNIAKQLEQVDYDQNADGNSEISALGHQNSVRNAGELAASYYCRNFTEYAKARCNNLTGSNSQSCVSDLSVTSADYDAWKRNEGVNGDEASVIASGSFGHEPTAAMYRGNSDDGWGDSVVASIREGETSTGVVDATGSTANTAGDGSVFRAQAMAAAAQLGAAGGNSNQVNGYTPFVNPISQKEAQADALERSISQRTSDIEEREEEARSLKDGAAKSSLEREIEEQRAALARDRAELEKMRTEIAELRRQSESQVAESDVEQGNSTTSESTRRRVSRAPASDGTGFAVGSSGGTGGQDLGSTAGSANFDVGNFNTSGAGSGSQASAPRSGSVKEALAYSRALNEANEAKAAARPLVLTVDGQQVPAEGVYIVEASGSATPADLARLVVAEPSKLTFINGYALVEVIRPGQAPVYYKVKEGALTSEVVNNNNNLAGQVRSWSASYANLLQRLKANREPSGQSN